MTEADRFPVHLFYSYEGTGRSLSLKLLQQLEEQTHTATKSVEGSLSGTYLLPPVHFRST